MKRVRIISLIALAVTLVVAVVLTLGYLYAIMPGHDGIPRVTVFLYGDSMWTYDLYYRGACISIMIALAVGLENIILSILDICKRPAGLRCE
ncbi:MAG: hypothetical protein IJ480_01795 [Clostridia bacterium]|nr:hypothetical protein [Clostridia bacterium]